MLSSRGCTTYILDRYAPPTTPANATFIRCDTTNWTDLVLAFKQAKRCDIAVANAGVSENGDFLEDLRDNEKDEKLDEPEFPSIDVNLVGTLKFVKLAIGYMRRQKRKEGVKWMQGAGGSIVITSSATGYAPEQSLPVYGATKAAVSFCLCVPVPFSPLSYAFTSYHHSTELHSVSGPCQAKSKSCPSGKDLGFIFLAGYLKNVW